MFLTYSQRLLMHGKLHVTKMKRGFVWSELFSFKCWSYWKVHNANVMLRFSFKGSTFIRFVSPLPKVAAWQVAKNSNKQATCECTCLWFKEKMYSAQNVENGLHRRNSNALVLLHLYWLAVHCVSGRDRDRAHCPTRPVSANTAASGG